MTFEHGLAAALLASSLPRLLRPRRSRHSLADIESELFFLRARSRALWAWTGAAAGLKLYGWLWALNLPALAWFCAGRGTWRVSWLVLGASAADLLLERSARAPLLRLAQAFCFLTGMFSPRLYRGTRRYALAGGRLSVLDTPLPRAALDNAALVRRLSQAGGRPQAEVLELLRREESWPGAAVDEELRRRGVEPYRWSEKLARFYEDSDAFLYELALWNRNRYKVAMRDWVMNHLGRAGGAPRRLLCYGDGLGFDSLCLAQLGHDVTYYEVPGNSARFARALFAETGARVRVADSDPLSRAAYDAVVCLDVLEHVPDPPALVARFAAALVPGGELIVHAPFGIVTPDVATHLDSNRRYYGRLDLYAAHGLSLEDGNWLWHPIVLKKGAPVHPPPASVTAMGALMRCGATALFWNLAVEKAARPLNWLAARMGAPLFSAAAAPPFRGTRLS